MNACRFWRLSWFNKFSAFSLVISASSEVRNSTLWSKVEIFFQPYFHCHKVLANKDLNDFFSLGWNSTDPLYCFYHGWRNMRYLEFRTGIFFISFPVWKWYGWQVCNALVSRGCVVIIEKHLNCSIEVQLITRCKVHSLAYVVVSSQ